jgi:hypothetical protein
LLSLMISIFRTVWVSHSSTLPLTVTIFHKKAVACILNSGKYEHPQTSHGKALAAFDPVWGFLNLDSQQWEEVWYLVVFPALFSGSA